MKKKPIAALIVMAASLAVSVMTVHPSGAQNAPPPIAVEVLTPRSTFVDDVDLGVRSRLDGRGAPVIKVTDPSRTVIARITIQPGAQFPWHTHSGPVFINIAKGEFVYVQADDCVPRTYLAGTALVDPGRGNVHTAFNPSDEETVVLATFFEATEAGPLTITDGVDPPDDCQIEVGSHLH
jgi:quercetin dioxygenase-like cupin family protein